MRYKMLYKHILIYVLITACSLILVNTVCYKTHYTREYHYYAENMYSMATQISSEYALDYFSESHLREIELELATISKLDGTRIIFIEPNGTVVLDTEYDNSNSSDSNVLYTVEGFDYSKLKGRHTEYSDFYGTFDSPAITVYAPITYTYEIKGYVVISMPESVVQDRVDATFNINYITLTIVLVLTLAFLIVYFIQVHKPLKKIIKATEEYGKGNFDYKINIKNTDEIGRLSSSLEYMANQVGDMDMFQQKFLSNISHDFRSPLTSIKGYLEAIEDGTVPPEMIKKYIRIILFETDRLTKLTSNILTLNELDPKSVRLEITTFDLNSIIRHTVETFEGKCKQRHINFSIIYASSKELVKGDKSKIGQVIYNLIDNAIKFSPDHSTIAITVKERGEKAFVSVKDHGCGIPKENLDKIFDRFYKSDASRGRDKKGSGLGLSITKEVIAAHDENIDVISTVGVGTEFTFTLELAKKSNSSFLD
ncbi:HAMP domain-containing sensor histidine kinase [Lachnospira multipara]|uniref:histidine kinase n=1 Tax=Lachnospira multipara TaxID=28051 RepID=A0A1H5SSU2_9FIRM|nr:HAMP domain-containing sensor histidine kinase [Lachnospira multipara]MBQ2472999.1 HAMP domain-containing histidine kinase [Lachnospira sp.]SEF52857.1 Signal transduction histidine kinase [Lachnospira multipara]